ncbi:MAG: rod shape-determining protein MreD [Drouetiella hepatica Uher 2000/2452]|uniref:Rod shape-determining protein MreD n=1 Tax=Drouetiella hepatica Uher 2000/2452 TaxID=904376 RepID=A0A951QCG5_9CYAN|nr:rod shape-determining protein MreD [Drouetiella hepatica Uher 2000/2452]
MIDLHALHPTTRRLLDCCVTAASVLFCLLLLPTRLPGMELLSSNPNWLLIWVVAWSVKRTLFQGALAGLALGLIQDGMTSPNPTHAFSLAIVGLLTARIQKPRYVKEDFISIALIVFGMAVLAETIIAIQFSLGTLGAESGDGQRTLSEIWIYHQQIALSSAILSSLWAPVVYYPLNHWWERIQISEQT